MPKKKPRKRSSSSPRGIVVTLRRTAVWLITAGAISIQATSCGLLPTPSSTPAPSVGHAGPTIATQFTGCREFFAGGVPPVVRQAPLQRELCYDAFAVLHSGTTKTPVFVAERLTRASVEDANEKRTNKFFADARLPRGERAELSDYKGSGYARGHMAPAGDMPNATAMAQSFSLANMVPQNPAQNSGAWSKIEQDTRKYALRAKGNVFVITGPVFGPESLTVGANRVRVPTHLFKLVYDESTGKAWAHWQPNSAEARAGRPISYPELTERIGMHLLPSVEVH
ncbi:DNA/RNA non-specific endonuclease [Variovorax sp. PDNC026]|uniref:DNA/RNA non-specific endonuclease n=1 Tax=Variovorax TaxID=34072 RepID=UPI0009C13378|nr:MULTISPECIES: DNA/RNA non-specific endonuclease [Variovorax]QRY30536.1 DNA/RNA non-specific endonuclease [Variovorax sp. PDNC026]